MAQEIEIKIRIEDSSGEKEMIELWLKENATFIQEENHYEWYLNDPDKSFKYTNKEGIIDAVDYLRIRSNDKGDSMTFKHWHRDPNNPNNHTHCDEYEFGITDHKQALLMMKALGYKDILVVEKRRKKFRTNDVEVVIDTVKGLGIFLEVELLEEYDDIPKAHKILKQKLYAMGFRIITEMTRGYVSMLWNKEKDWGVTKNLENYVLSS